MGSGGKGHPRGVADPGTTEFQVTLTADSNAARIGREFVDEHVDLLPAGMIDDAKLLVSELVTNAVLHGRPDITLRLRLGPPSIGFSVHDDGPSIPSDVASAPDPEATGGRGLMIVDQLASSWGVVVSDPPPGKSVWFRLDRP